MKTTILFHPSALAKIMTGTAKGWDVEKSVTCKRELVKLYREIIYDRRYYHTNKYTEKGLQMEEDAITLYSRFRGKMYTKNDKRFTNAFFNGEPDIIDLENSETIDTKCSWSLETFPSLLIDEIDKDYEYQGRGYMDLTGCKKHTVAYCLVNAPEKQVLRAKENIFYAMNCPSSDDDNYIAACIEIEKNMIFDKPQFVIDNPFYDFDCKVWSFDIPVAERVVEFTIDYDADKLTQIKERITACREWMNKNLF